MEVESGWKLKVDGSGRYREVKVNGKLQWMALLGHHTNQRVQGVWFFSYTRENV